MQNVSDIFAAWPSDAEFGRDIGVPYPTISAWKQRASIPAAYWCHIIRAAARRGYPEITADLLARLHATSKTGAGENGTATAGYFSPWKHLRRANFASPGEIAAHVAALREEWDRR